MKQIAAFLSILFMIILFSCSSKRTGNKYEKMFESEEVEKDDGPAETMARDSEMMRDPKLGYVPTQRLLAAKSYKDQLMANLSQTNNALAGMAWKPQGPKNQGGRTRALLVDANDATGNTVWAGSVGGGLWKTTNINAAIPNWIATNDFFSNLAISSIAQNPANAQIMYFTTGESYGNSDAIRGNGVWKTIDGGSNWAQLASTTGTIFNSCLRIAINATGIVFVSTKAGGLQRSADGGTTWTKVLGTGLAITGAASDLSYDVEVAANGDVWATLSGSIHKSTDAGVTFAAAQTLPITGRRIEVACAPNDANYVYAVLENANLVNGIIKTTNGGTTWASQTEPADADTNIPATDFSRSQAWYDLSLVVDPGNKDALFVGGVDLFKSINGGTTWTQMTHWYGGFGKQFMHADQHLAYYRPGSSSIAYFTNDGGVYQTTNATATVPTITDKGTGYVTAQFYSCAMNPAAGTYYFLAGAQDNGSHQFSSNGLQNTVQATGGDGAFCHIDQDQPQYQFTSYVYNSFYRSSDGGSTFTSVSTTGGTFISPTDYDDVNNKLYMCDGSGNYRRWDDPQTGSTFVQVTAAAFAGTVSAIKVSPNTANRVFFGINNGKVFRADNANTATPTFTDLSTGLPGGFVTCVEVETGNDNHLLVTYSNYGLNSIWESINGGTSWTSVEGNIPDMPVRWALFNPNNNDQAIIATELGVWSTDNLNGTSTVWGASNSGLANVRVDMLQVRQSDKLVVAATHGRGLFTSDLFTVATALLHADKLIAYQSVNVNFSSDSYKATSWAWNFGDGATSTAENPSHIYSASGKYNVTLSVNGGASSIVKSSYIKILPNRGTPYAITDGGNFEVNTDDFGADNSVGTPWQLGNSSVANKNGTHAGAAAWVTGLTGNYADNTVASLMTPNYNFNAAGTYTLKFWSKFATEMDYDGFRVEYSLDKGTSWTALGTTVAANWYNNANIAGTTSFPASEAFFSGTVATFTQYSRDVSFLANNPQVAFRIIFKADVNTNAAGVAFDDFEIIGPPNVVLPLSLTNFQAFNSGNDVALNWNTEQEINVAKFGVERSADAVNFTTVGFVAAQNLATATYNYLDPISKLNPQLTGFAYYRLKMMDKDGHFTYSSVAKVALSKSFDITVGPNPFSNQLYIYSPFKINNIVVFNVAGKLVFQTNTISGNNVTLPSSLAKGTYFIKIETSSGIFQKKLVK